MITLYNTLSKQKVAFIPADPHRIGMYVCGPTVYDRAHIGNARAIVVFDTLYRILCHTYSPQHVTYVRNITDVDDKINARAKERSISIDTPTRETISLFHKDMEAIGCIPLHSNTEGSHRIEPKATEHITDMIALTERLIAQNHAYVSHQHVLFHIDSFPDYGHLSRRNQEEMLAGARVEIAPYKKNPGDFVLWKPSSSDEPGWESPWGRGRPGWHLECSAMSTRYLGETFDIHGGGIDLQFPHHENEIAQSCCAYPGSHFARYWIHNGFLTVEGEKMSKSLNNFITVEQALNGGIKGEVIRYVLLSTHYRKPLDWTDKAVSDAAKALDYYYTALLDLELSSKSSTISDSLSERMNAYMEALSDDLNTPQALAHLQKLTSYAHKSDTVEKQSALWVLKQCGEWIGLLQQQPREWLSQAAPSANTAIAQLVEKRNQARLAKDWQEADRIRKLLEQQGIRLKDLSDGRTDWL